MCSMYEVYVSVTALIKQISSGRRYRSELCGAVPAILADPYDDIALAAATDAGGAEAIVHGNGRLLGIGEFQGIPIVTPSAAVNRLAV